MANKFSLEAVFSATDKLSAPLAKIRGKLDQFAKVAGRSLGALDKRMGALHGGIKRIGAAAFAVGAVGSVAALSIGKAGADFEQAITAVGAVSLQTRAQIADLEAEALRLGATTKFSATEAANAMETMSRAGFTNAQIIAGVGSVLSGAAAEGIEIEEMANHVSNALKGMGLETSETARVVDVLALASARTNSSIGSIGQALSGVASTARQFKIPLEDVVAGVALLQDVGLDAEVSGSALNTMLTQMAAPTDSIKKKMKQFGVTFQDANGDMLPFQDVLANVSKAAKASGGNMDQVAFMAELVGLRGQKAAANLKDLFETGKVQELTKELKNAAGSAKMMADIRMDNTYGDMEKLESAIDGVKLSLFNTQSGPLREIIQSMTKWVDANKDLIIKKFQDWVVWIRDNFERIVFWLKAIGLALGVFYTLWAAVKFAQLSIAAYEIGVKLASKATWLWHAAVKAYNFIAGLNVAAVGAQVTAMAPMLLMIGAAAAAVGGLVAAWMQYNKLDKDLEGSGGITGTVGKMWEMGTWDPFTAHDAVMNEKAKAARKKADEEKGKQPSAQPGVPGAPQAGSPELPPGVPSTGNAEDDRKLAALMEEARREQERNQRNPEANRRSPAPQVITPQARAAAEYVEANANVKVDGKITVEALPGTKATVKQQPSRIPIIVRPSGAFVPT